MITKEQEKLFNFVRMSLGAPMVLVQLTDDMLCSLMEYCVQEYQGRIAQFLSIQNWSQLYGKNIGRADAISNNDIAWAITHRNFDYAKQFSYFFSKEIGQQSGGNWELKKDYFLIERGKQSYVIPAGRTINSVLYVTPNTTDPALVSGVGGFGGGDGMMFGGAGYGYGGSVAGMGGMMAQVGGAGGGARFGMGGSMFAFPAYDFALLASDLNLKQKLVGGELIYKVTAMASGEHIIHLISTPGNKFWNNMQLFGNGNQCACWYTYYDTSQGGADECAKLNTDVLLSPDQYPVTVHGFEFMSPMSQQSIQTLLLAKAKQTLGYIRGYASGEVKIDDAIMKMDYNMLIQDGKSEWDKELESINKWLEHLHPKNQLKYQQEMVESMYAILGAIPNPILVM